MFASVALGLLSRAKRLFAAAPAGRRYSRHELALLAVLRAAERLATALDPLPDCPANIFPLRRPDTPPDALLELDFGTTAPSPHAFTLLEAAAVVRVQPAPTSNPAPEISLNLPCPA